METINPLDHLADLAVFVRVVDTQGFSSAARAMGLTKSAISKRINRLEKQLGLRLLQRTTRAMSLTEAGRVLYERAAQGVALLDETARLAAGLVDAPRGTLRVTASVTFGKLCLAPLIPEFLARYPEIELQLTLLDRFVDLVDEGYDVALRLTRTPPEQVVAKALMPVRYRLCAAVDYLKGQKIETPADLAGHNCLHYGLREFGNEWRFQRIGAEKEEARVSASRAMSWSITAKSSATCCSPAWASVWSGTMPSTAKSPMAGCCRYCPAGRRSAPSGRLPMPCGCRKPTCRPRSASSSTSSPSACAKDQ
jgi:DNA-binding transcriptional LysR family regulator